MINTTDKDVVEVIKFQRTIDEYSKDNLSIQLKYSDSILVINDKTQTLMTKKLDYKQVDKKIISIILPPKSTVLVGGSINRPISADSIKFIQNNLAKDYSINDIYKKTNKSGGLFPPFHITYVIK